MYKTTQLAHKFRLSRTAILYYDAIGLLRPDKRTASGYRLYSDQSVRKLERICELREAGLDLKKIKAIIDAGTSKKVVALQERLHAINQEIAALRKQQRIIVEMLQDDGAGRGRTRIMTKERWVDLLRKAGLDDDGLHKWHKAFEASSPETHQDFLESIGLPEKEIRQMRAFSHP